MKLDVISDGAVVLPLGELCGIVCTIFFCAHRLRREQPSEGAEADWCSNKTWPVISFSSVTFHVRVLLYPDTASQIPATVRLLEVLNLAEVPFLLYRLALSLYCCLRLLPVGIRSPAQKVPLLPPKFGQPVGISKKVKSRRSAGVDPQPPIRSHTKLPSAPHDWGSSVAAWPATGRHVWNRLV